LKNDNELSDQIQVTGEQDAQKMMLKTEEGANSTSDAKISANID
jgi:hypothetical protein